MNHLYMLTRMTGKRSKEDRTSVIGTFEVKMRGFWVGMLGFLLGVCLAGLFVSTIGPVGLFIFAPITTLGSLLLFNTRQRGGMGLYHWRAMKNAYVSRASGNRHQMMFHHQPLQVNPTEVKLLSASSVPVVRTDAEGNDLDDEHTNIFEGIRPS